MDRSSGHWGQRIGAQIGGFEPRVAGWYLGLERRVHPDSSGVDKPGFGHRRRCCRIVEIGHNNLSFPEGCWRRRHRIGSFVDRAGIRLAAEDRMSLGGEGGRSLDLVVDIAGSLVEVGIVDLDHNLAEEDNLVAGRGRSPVAGTVSRSPGRHRRSRTVQTL